MGRREKKTRRGGRGNDDSSLTAAEPIPAETAPTGPIAPESISPESISPQSVSPERTSPEPTAVGSTRVTPLRAYPLAPTEPTSSTNRRRPFMKRFDTRRAVLLAVFLPLAVLAVTVGLVWQQIARVGIDGSWNYRAALADEVTADVSSSGQNLNEAYLVARQLTLETDTAQVKALSDRLDQLEARYRDRHLYWNAVVTSGPLRKSLVLDADQAGTEFWKAVRDGLLPLTRGTDLAARKTVLTTRIDPPFNRQQTALKVADQQAATERAAAAADGAAAADRARNLLLTMLGVGVVAALVAVLVAPRLARRPIRRLQEGEAEAAARLRATDPSAHDVPVIEPVVADTRDLEGLADTFNSLVRTSVEGLESQIKTRKANEQLFISLGRRSQNLVGRQIRFIDQLEQHEADPDALAALFQMDHLATRMRRNAESLLVIAGLDSPRTWKNPAAALEVAHAAASETEQYTRVQFGPIPSTAIQGSAIANVVHLLAELIDNALRYSPPETSVVVSATMQDGRLLFAVTDAGMGMSAGDLKVVNGRLSGEALNDRSPAPQLGLTVVARLAARHNIGIRLAATGAQGLTAWVELPPELLVASGVPTVDAGAGQSVQPEQPEQPQQPAGSLVQPVSNGFGLRGPVDTETQTERVPALMSRTPDDSEEKPVPAGSVPVPAASEPVPAGMAAAHAPEDAQQTLTTAQPGAPVLTRAGFLQRVPQAHATLFSSPLPAFDMPPSGTDRKSTPEEMREQLRLFRVGKDRAISSSANPGERPAVSVSPTSSTDFPAQ